MGDLGLIPGLGRSPGEGNGNPFQYSCLENPHGQRSLVGYHAWGLKELDTTKQLNININMMITDIISMLPSPIFLGFPGGSDGKESTCNVGDLGSIPRLGRSPGGGHGEIGRAHV